MHIGSISQLYQQYPLSLIGSTNPSSGAGAASGPLQISPPGAAQTTPAGGLFDALMQALTQSGALTSTTAATSAAGTATTTTDAKATSAIGAGATSASGTASTSAAGTESPQQAMQAFIQKLVSALQSQGAATPTAAGTNATPTAATSASTPAPAASGGAQMKTALQDLINGASTTTGSTGGSSALASLQQSFQNLVATMGGSPNASLSGFLTNFASDLSGMNAVGNLVNTQA
jgi:hypothetical protein